MKKITAFLTAVLVLGTVLSSCGGGMKVTEDDMRTVLAELLPKAEELNVIYFGEGLPMTEDAEALNAFYNSFDTDITSINYHPVDPACGYENEQQIREATLEVFTEAYSEYLFERAFSGISATYDEGTAEQRTETAVYAMYIEQNGILTARVDLAEEALTLGRVYDLDALEIDHTRENYVVVTIPTELDGRALDVDLKLVMTDDGWRLDSPTY